MQDFSINAHLLNCMHCVKLKQEYDENDKKDNFNRMSITNALARFLVVFHNYFWMHGLLDSKTNTKKKQKETVEI